MPGVYRLKKCPTCGTEHRKRGQYCSRSCGNHREFNQQHRENLAKSAYERMTNTDEGQLLAFRLAELKRTGLSDEDYTLLPPNSDTTPDGFVAGGDFWTESDS